jgi:transposase InsO family protein
MITASFSERKLAIFLLRKGKTMREVAESMDRSLFWVSKWNKRYHDEGWAGLYDRSRAPKNHGRQLSLEIREAIRDTRLELEVEAALGTGLKYIGGQAIKTRLKINGVKPLPSLSSIERVLHETGLISRKEELPEPKIIYPHLRPSSVHQLYQVDIVPHFLRGGQHVPCFNVIDVISRYPEGKAFAQRRSLDAMEFLIYMWKKMGIPKYTQVDNEGCFSGGTTHKYVLGKTVRLALAVGTELLFSPVYHPKSNSHVERFHRDYNRHVWEDTYLEDIANVNKQAQWFFRLYRERLDHKELNEQSPRQLHEQIPVQKLDDNFDVVTTKLPLYEGCIHFLRRVSDDGQVRVLNVDWNVSEFDVLKGVWVTINFQLTGATLSIFDKAPDLKERRCVDSYPFPLKESVLPRSGFEKGVHEYMDNQIPKQEQRNVE